MRTKLLTMFVTLAMLVCSLSASASVEIDGIQYDLIRKGKVAEVVGCTYSGDVIIPATVTYEDVVYDVVTIGEMAFRGKGLTSITIPPSVTTIEEDAFYDNLFLTAVYISDIEAWCKISFGDNPLANSQNGNSGNLYLNGELVTELVIPEGVTYIGKDTFYGCRSITTVTLPESVAGIGDGAFCNCWNLTSINVPFNVNSIGTEAFYNCENLTSINIPEGVAEIGKGTFSRCLNLTSITIPKSVAKIGDHAFYWCSSLTTITISGNSRLTSIGYEAFIYCSSLTTITLPKSVTSIGYGAFRGCSSLTSITLPKVGAVIGDYAFYDCSSLTSIVLPSNQEKIGEKAFAYCLELLDVYCYSKAAPKAAADAFYGSYPEYVTLHVPTSALENYQTATPWNSFGKIETFVAEEEETEEEETFVAVEKILISPSQAAVLYEGQSLQFTATVLPSNADNKDFSWFLYNGNVDPNDIASVDETGLVTAKSPGMVLVGTVAADGCEGGTNLLDGLTFCVLEVKKITTSITLNHTTAKLFTDETLQLTATAHSEDADDISCTWESSSPIAVVNDYGLVTPLAAGEVTITATANDGSGVSASCTIIIEEPPLFTITFLVDGEVFHTAQIARGSNLREAGLHNITPEPKTGYTFSGWSEMPETMPAHDIVVSGTYILNKYRVTFKVGDKVVSSKSMEYGASIVAPEAPEKEGHTFAGWGEVDETVPAHDVTYEGSYTVNNYTVTFKIGEEVFYSESLPYGTEITAPEAPEKEGHTFNGWGEVAETVPANDVTYEGSYSVNSYKLTYSVDGEIVEERSIKYGTAIILPEEPTKEGYTFSGWSEAPEIMPAEDVVIYGTFKVNQYSIIYMVDGKVFATETIDYGADITLPEIPEKEGYVFAWVDEIPEAMPAKDITIYGVYTEITNIEDVAVEGDVLYIYTLDGQRISKLRQGINILWMKDSSTRKVLVK